MTFRRYNLLLVSLFTLLLSSCASNLPSDEQMIAEFYEREAEFEALFERVRVWETDSWMTQTNTQKLSNYVPPLSEKQASEIQAQMIDLGVRGLSVSPEIRYEDDQFSVLMTTANSNDHAADQVLRTGNRGRKGYAYLAKPLPTSCIFNKELNYVNIEELGSTCLGLIYRPIEEGWYLYLYRPGSY